MTVSAHQQSNLIYGTENSITQPTYNLEEYDTEILSYITEEFILALQETVNDKKETNSDVTEDELNIFIMDSIQEEYNRRIMLRSSNVPYSQDILNSEEKALFSSDPVKGLFAVSSAYTATTWTNNNFDSSVTYLGNGDAYRHSFWQAILANAYGSSYAKQWGDAHESESPSGVDKTMDLRNNSIGRSVGTSMSGNQYIEARLSSALLNKIANGDLWRVVNGKLCSTDGTGRK